jgi:H+/Cl- antiporter ClcA
LGAALFVLEIPHRRGLEFFEAIIPTLTSAVLGFVVFRYLTGVTFGGIYDFPPYAQLRPEDIASAVLLGVIGAGIGLLFLGIDYGIKWLLQPLRQRPLLLITLGGLGFGVIAAFFPITLFYGEAQIQDIMDTGSRYSPWLLFGIAVIKMVALSLSLESGFKGGVVFPIFFVGACVGMGIHQLLPGIPVSVALVCMMAATGVAIVNAPMSMIMILSTISHTSITPLITTAALTSFILTEQFTFVPTQQCRQDLNQILGQREEPRH